MAYVFFKRRPMVSTKTIVEITGTGHTNLCYAKIGGTNHAAAVSDIEVFPGDVITFLVRGYSRNYAGQVVIDGSTVLSVTSQTTKTYEWTVPANISKIAIALSYNSIRGYGTITVTTS